ncbi:MULTISPECIES: molybdopterin-guanine dinucleotide biosynthesis protein MobB [Dickeya]|uniref:Molybdopterin-guanine dinucleotide biosynthesis protein MobB n=1 Tax=Dickeya aquatica TaxID=1401087 RepID=A0A375A525_9GAMM|nr:MULTISPECIES: molybdopterin-guanine dinucleotide biosynthesis protein MobB [Dickeya]SLM61164.1 Molybdopterin-guanine dinucleotide biosynthesis protein MobB [Dickeya aquatica]
MADIPILAIVAHSGTGKTTLLKQLIPELNKHGIRVGIIKHTHHDMDVDKPGKDSYELRKAGARQTLVASNTRWALMTETPEQQEPNLFFLASRMDSSTLDLILVEGFKHESVDKILLYRHNSGNNEVMDIDDCTLAIASDVPLTHPKLCLDLNQPPLIAVFIRDWLHKRKVSA